MRKPRRRLTVGLLMILVALAAIGLWAYDDARRIRVRFDNQTVALVRDVTVRYADQTVHLGPVEPGKTLERRIAAPPTEPVHVAWDVAGDPGRPDRHVQSPGVVASGPGGMVRIMVKDQPPPPPPIRTPAPGPAK